MDKFRELETQIEKIIERINEEIKDKQSKMDVLNEGLDYEKELLSTTEKMLEEVNTKREILSQIESKSIILYIIKNGFKKTIQEYLEYVKNKQLFPIILCPSLALITAFLIFIAVICGGIPSILVISALISLYFMGTELDVLIKLHRLKKNYTLVGVSANREDLIKSISIHKEEIARYKDEVRKLYEEIQSLEQEKERHNADLKRVRDAREQVIEEKAPAILNEAFTSFDYSEIIKRVRKNRSKKKEGGRR